MSVYVCKEGGEKGGKMRENKSNTQVFGGTSVCRVGTHVLCSLCAECLIEEDLVCRCELFCGSAEHQFNDKAKKLK